MSDLSSYFLANAAWAKNVTLAQPSFYTELAKKQAPPLLWIGCGDSRVPESRILDTMPGQVFTHRNIANQYQANDSNAGAVVEYGVLHLNISDIVVVGHTNCGGCKAANEAAAAELAAAHTNGSEQCNSSSTTHPRRSGGGAATSPLNTFLGPLIALQKELGNSSVHELILANVQRSVENIAESDTFKQAWESGLNVSVHGWLYNLSSGLLTDLNMSKHNFA